MCNTMIYIFFVTHKNQPKLEKKKLLRKLKVNTIQ